MGAERQETARATVKTYVPAYQKEQWRDAADELDMSLSEFVRTMVQAGRRGILEEPSEGTSSTSDPQGYDLEKQVLDVLSSEGYCDWDTLRGRLGDRLEDALDSTLEDLQRRDRVRYSGPRGGYTVVTDGE